MLSRLSILLFFRSLIFLLTNPITAATQLHRPEEYKLRDDEIAYGQGVEQLRDSSPGSVEVKHADAEKGAAAL